MARVRWAARGEGHGARGWPCTGAALLSRRRASAATAWVLCSRPCLLYRLSCTGGGRGLGDDV